MEIRGLRFKGTIPYVSQSGIERLNKGINDKVGLTIGKVLAVHMDRMTCQIEGPNGAIMDNVPLIATCGLETEEVWGRVEMPSLESHVIIGFIEDRESFPIILGTLFPYVNPLYQTDQVPVASADNKLHTLKLLETDLDEKTYRKIFKSGTTVEVQADGTIIVETPSGAMIQIDEADEDAAGAINITSPGKVTATIVGDVTVTSEGLLSIAVVGNLTIDSEEDLTLSCDGDMTIAAGGTLDITSAGAMTIESDDAVDLVAGGNLGIEDGNGNTLAMGSSGVDINGGNLVVG